jgi:signal peptidase I
VIDEPVAADLSDPDTAVSDADGRAPNQGGSHRKVKPSKAARAAKPDKPPKPKKKTARPFWVEALVLLVIAAVIAVGVHSFLFQAFFIPSGSMENTLHVGDRVLVNRLSYRVGHVQRGQIVVFSGVDSWTPEGSVAPTHNPVLRELRKVGSYLGFAPSGEQDFIKRVIGVPGDHLTCCDAQGRISVNGKPLDETYLFAGADPDVFSTSTAVNKSAPFDIVVPAGRLWVEGDHRDDSADSRRHTGDPGGGTIPINKVVGRAFVIVWPVSHTGTLSVPKSYRSVSNTTASALPSVIGVGAVAPVALIRRRRRRRSRSRAT